MWIKKYKPVQENPNSLYLIHGLSALSSLPLSGQEKDFITRSCEPLTIHEFGFNRFTHYVYVQVINDVNGYVDIEKLRRKGDCATDFFQKAKQKSLVLHANGLEPDVVLAYLEGMALGAYQFLQYKENADKQIHLEELWVESDLVSDAQLSRLENIIRACYITRDMVNEPVNVLDSGVFAQKMADYCRKAGAKVSVFGKHEISNLGMEGLLTVNKGSKTDPTFTVIEWKPVGISHTQPIVLVGKGLVFDTGGINLKPGAGLETMKCDMAGGAAVFGALYALAMNKVPVHAIGLIPATDNRPGENAMVPGDIIRMENGKTVEIINTDAEGRLILADALLYARKYHPRLVVNMATLTGAAEVALGRFAIAGMHQDAGRYMKSLIESSMRVNERVVEFPFWDDYNQEIESDVADIRNVGKGRGAGIITAGKFLSHFIDYPWIHLDIASMAFMDSRDSYNGKGATAVGLRLLYDFIERES